MNMNFVNGVLTGAAIIGAIVALNMTFDVSLVEKLRSYWKTRNRYVAGSIPVPYTTGYKVPVAGLYEVPAPRTLMVAPTLLAIPAKPKMKRAAKSTKKPSGSSRRILAARRKKS